MKTATTTMVLAALGLIALTTTAATAKSPGGNKSRPTSSHAGSNHKTSSHTSSHSHPHKQHPTKGHPSKGHPHSHHGHVHHDHHQHGHPHHHFPRHVRGRIVFAPTTVIDPGLAATNAAWVGYNPASGRYSVAFDAPGVAGADILANAGFTATVLGPTTWSSATAYLRTVGAAGW